MDCRNKLVFTSKFCSETSKKLHDLFRTWFFYLKNGIILVILLNEKIGTAFTGLGK
jgi:hypothetical protein